MILQIKILQCRYITQDKITINLKRSICGMKKFLSAFFLTILLINCASIVQANEISVSNTDGSSNEALTEIEDANPTIAIMNFAIFKNAKGEIQTEERASWLSDYVISDLEDSYWFNLMELKSVNYHFSKDKVTYSEPISLSAAKEFGKNWEFVT